MEVEKVNVDDVEDEQMSDSEYQVFSHAIAYIKSIYLTREAIFLHKKDLWEKLDDDGKVAFIKDFIEDNPGNNEEPKDMQEFLAINTIDISEDEEKLQKVIDLSNEDEVHIISMSDASKLKKKDKALIIEKYMQGKLIGNREQIDLFKEHVDGILKNVDFKLLCTWLAVKELRKEAHENVILSLQVKDADKVVFRIADKNEYVNSRQYAEDQEAFDKLFKEYLEEHPEMTEEKLKKASSILRKLKDGLLYKYNYVITRDSTWFFAKYDEIRDTVTSYEEKRASLEEEEADEPVIPPVQKTVNRGKAAPVFQKSSQRQKIDTEENLQKIWLNLSNSLKKKPTSTARDNIKLATTTKTSADNKNYYNLSTGTLITPSQTSSSGRRTVKDPTATAGIFGKKLTGIIKTGDEFPTESKIKIAVSQDIIVLNPPVYDLKTLKNTPKLIIEILQFLYNKYIQTYFPDEILEDVEANTTSVSFDDKEATLEDITGTVGEEEATSSFARSGTPQNIGIFVGINTDMINLLPVLPQEIDVESNILPEIDLPDEEKESIVLGALTAKHPYSGNLEEISSIISAIRRENKDTMDENMTSAVNKIREGQKEVTQMSGRTFPLKQFKDDKGKEEANSSVEVRE